jgi:hypothetical protein
LFLLLLPFFDIGLGVLDTFLKFLNVGLREADQVLHLLPVCTTFLLMVELLSADRDEFLPLALALLLDGIYFLDSLFVVHVERFDSILALLQRRHFLRPEKKHLELPLAHLADCAFEQGVSV